MVDEKLVIPWHNGAMVFDEKDNPWDLSTERSAVESDLKMKEQPVSPLNQSSVTQPLPTDDNFNGLLPSQRDVFDNLLAIGMARPVAPVNAVDKIKEALLESAGAGLQLWTETTFRVGKAQIAQVLRCGGSALAAKKAGYNTTGAIPLPVAAGLVTHKAVQMSWTHPNCEVAQYVKAAILSCCEEERFGKFWAEASLGTQSDIIATATVRTTSFLDSWPPLLSAWSPRFEEPMSARVGSLVLSSRPDFIMGRPRAGGRRTILLCDFKSGDLKEEHLFEARFYAVVTTLRWGVLPWRSTVFSLASGQYTDPDFELDTLLQTATQIGQAVSDLAAIYTENTEPTYTPGVYCKWCSAIESCQIGSEFLN